MNGCNLTCMKASNCSDSVLVRACRAPPEEEEPGRTAPWWLLLWVEVVLLITLAARSRFLSALPPLGVDVTDMWTLWELWLLLLVNKPPCLLSFKRLKWLLDDRDKSTGDANSKENSSNTSSYKDSLGFIRTEVRLWPPVARSSQRTSWNRCKRLLEKVRLPSTWSMSSKSSSSSRGVIMTERCSCKSMTPKSALPADREVSATTCRFLDDVASE